MMKRSLIRAFVTIAALVAMVSCRGTTVPTDPPPEPPPVVAAPTLTGGAWVAEEPWIEAVEGDPVERGTIRYKLTFTTSRFIHNEFAVESGSTAWSPYAESGTWRADDTTITKVVLVLDEEGEGWSTVEYVKSYRFEDDGDTLVMTYWNSENEFGPTRELRYTRVRETSIIGSWEIYLSDQRVEFALQVLKDGTFSFVQTVTPEVDAEVTSISGRYTDDPDENFLTLSDVSITVNDVSVPVLPEEGMRFAYASLYGDDRIVLSRFQYESNPDSYPYGLYNLALARVRT